MCIKLNAAHYNENCNYYRKNFRLSSFIIAVN